MSNRKNRWVGALIGLMIVASLTFSGLATGAEFVKVGSILGLTGDNAAYGQNMKRGFDFALEEINSQGGVGNKRIDLVVEDSQFDPSKAVTAYRKLTGVEGVKVIVGITGSKNALPVCEAAKGDDVVIVDALGSAPKLSTEGGPNYFRVMASDALAGQYNIDWAIENGMKKPVIVYVEDDWGVSYRDAITRYAGKKGFSKIPSHGVIAGTRDFRIQIEKVKSEKPDAIFLLLYAKEGAVFMQQLRQAEIRSAVYGSDNISSPEFTSAGAAVVDGVFVAMPAPAHGPLYEQFVSKYKSKYGEDPDANIIKSYDAMNVAVNAIRSAGYEPSKIRTYLHSPDFKYDGVSGVIKFDPNGDLTSQEYSRMIYHNGNLVLVK